MRDETKLNVNCCVLGPSGFSMPLTRTRVLKQRPALQYLRAVWTIVHARVLCPCITVYQGLYFEGPSRPPSAFPKSFRHLSRRLVVSKAQGLFDSNRHQSETFRFVGVD